MDFAGFISTLEPWQYWFAFAFILLIAELATGATTYLLWPAAAAGATALIALFGFTNWIAEVAIFAVLLIVFTWAGRPLVEAMKRERAAINLNERSASLIGARAVVANFANGVGHVQVQDTVWRATSDEALEAGQSVIVDSVDGATLKVKRV